MSMHRLTVVHNTSEGWGIACGGPVGLALYTPAGTAVDAAGNANALSNIL